MKSKTQLKVQSLIRIYIKTYTMIWLENNIQQTQMLSIITSPLKIMQNLRLRKQILFITTLHSCFLWSYFEWKVYISIAGERRPGGHFAKIAGMCTLVHLHFNESSNGIFLFCWWLKFREHETRGATRLSYTNSGNNTGSWFIHCTTLQGKSPLCIPFLGIARPQP